MGKEISLLKLEIYAAIFSEVKKQHGSNPLPCWMVKGGDFINTTLSRKTMVTTFPFF